MASEIEKRGEVAILWIDNPPVNAINTAVRDFIAESLAALADDAAVKAVVIGCRGRTFMAGADIKEFGLVANEKRAASDFLGALRRFGKPLVAALHGTALGGGFEVALCCDYRVALRSARMGLPEVKIGLLPGGGGTQRLPRLIGVGPALDVMLSGEQIDAEKALKLGIIDHITDETVADAAVQLAREVVGKPLRRLADTVIDLATAGPEVFAAARKKIATQMRNQHAPERIVECVEAAVSLPFDAGLAFETEQFGKCRADIQSKALQHIFFAERQLGKIPGLPADVQSLPIETAAVIGAGTMGGGIAMNFVNVGIPVTLLETSQEALDRGVGVIRKNYEISAAKGRMTAEDVERRMAMIRPTLSYADIGGADIVIEAVFETMDIKQAVFRQIDAHAKPSAILASNTSRMSIDTIADATARPGSVVGTHFFSPANVMKLCEVVRGHRTAPATLRTALDVAQRIKKVGVVSADTDGFIGNHMISGYIRQSERIILEGPTPQEVDAALYGFGMAMGPFAMADLAGIDVAYKSKQNYDQSTLDLVAGTALNRLVEAGRYGQKTSAGYYDYDPGSRVPKPSQFANDIIAQVARENGIERRQISAEEIVERVLLELFNVGCEVLRKGTAYRAGDIDAVYINGYGFPAYRGGPMFWAEHEVGLPQALEKIRHYGKLTGERWLTPSPLLEQLVAEERGFASIPGA